MHSATLAYARVSHSNQTECEAYSAVLMNEQKRAIQRLLDMVSVDVAFASFPAAVCLPPEVDREHV